VKIEDHNPSASRADAATPCLTAEPPIDELELQLNCLLY
jgi:hypothetical protein